MNTNKTIEQFSNLLVTKKDFESKHGRVDFSYSAHTIPYLDFEYAKEFVVNYIVHFKSKVMSGCSLQLLNGFDFCVRNHPSLVDFLAEHLDYSNSSQIDFFGKRIVANYESQALFIKTVLERNPEFIVYKSNSLIKSTSNYKVGCAYLIDVVFPFIEQAERLEHMGGIGLIKEIAKKDSYFAIKSLSILFRLGNHLARKSVMYTAIANNEQFAIYILNLPNPAETTWFPDYSKNKLVSPAKNEYENDHYLFGYKNLEEEMFTLLKLACGKYFGFADRHKDSCDFDILLNVLRFDDLHEHVAFRKDLSNEIKIELIKQSKNKHFAKTLKNSFDIFVLREILTLCDDMSDYIINERSNLSEKQKNWLKMEYQKIQRQQKYERDRSFYASIRNQRYDEVVKKNARLGRRYYY